MGRPIRHADPGGAGGIVIFIPMTLPGAWLIDLEPQVDERGFFARSWCSREFEAQGLNPRLLQCNVSYNHRRGTLRGMHYQDEPYGEAKLIRCTAGAVYDVVLDLRAGSPTFLCWEAAELTAQDHRLLYVPEGFAHGFQTLADDTEVFYQMSEVYRLGYARGVRWDDPVFGIRWPDGNPILSEKDRSYPDFAVQAGWLVG
jgi:dTDP-4-dehydrorhamnose 3,5-epimerase